MLCKAAQWMPLPSQKKTLLWFNVILLVKKDILCQGVGLVSEVELQPSDLTS